MLRTRRGAGWHAVGKRLGWHPSWHALQKDKPKYTTSPGALACEGGRRPAELCASWANPRKIILKETHQPTKTAQPIAPPVAAVEDEPGDVLLGHVGQLLAEHVLQTHQPAAGRQDVQPWQ